VSANTYDAIVIGGGHNGLVAAAYLAQRSSRSPNLARHGHGTARGSLWIRQRKRAGGRAGPLNRPHERSGLHLLPEPPATMPWPDSSRID
jgi:glycine/D-amino acid oxidase-like deaminating enzyme